MIRCVLLALLTGLVSTGFAAEVEGRLGWARKLVLSVPVSGVVQEVVARPGDRVQSDQVLLRLDPRPFRTRLARARANLDRATPEREEAQRELERARELYDRTVLSDHELQLARIAFAQADADQRIAEAALAQAELDLEYSVVRAPFDALVLDSHAEVGQTVITVHESVPLLTLVSIDRMLAMVELSLERGSTLEAGTVIPVTVEGRRYEGRLRRLVPEPSAWVDNQPRYSVEVLITVPLGQTLRPGQPALVELP